MKKLNKGVLLLIILSGMSFSFMLPEQIIPTTLRITVRNELGNAEEGVKVEIFVTEDDYKQEVNHVQPAGTTDKKGNVTFKNLEERVYFVNAVKGDKNNFGAGVQTDTLKSGKINKVTIIIE